MGIQIPAGGGWSQGQEIKIQNPNTQLTEKGGIQSLQPYTSHPWGASLYSGSRRNHRLLTYQHPICERPPFTPPACLDHRLCTGTGGLLLKPPQWRQAAFLGSISTSERNHCSITRYHLASTKHLRVIFFPHKVHLKSLYNTQNNLCLPHNRGGRSCFFF